MAWPVFGAIRNIIDGALDAFSEKGSPSKWIPSRISWSLALLCLTTLRSFSPTYDANGMS